MILVISQSYEYYLLINPSYQPRRARTEFPLLVVVSLWRVDLGGGELVRSGRTTTSSIDHLKEIAFEFIFGNAAGDIHIPVSYRDVKMVSVFLNAVDFF